MRIDHIDQVTLNVTNLEESMALFTDTLGITFLPIREVTVGEKHMRFAWTSLGLGLVESDPPEPEGFRAIGFQLEDLPAVKEKMTKLGKEPLLEVDREFFREAHYELNNVRFSMAEYPSPPATRVASVMLGDLWKQKKEQGS